MTSICSKDTTDLGKRVKDVAKQVCKVMKSGKSVKRVCQQMQKTVLFESESMLQKVMSGLIQED